MAQTEPRAANIWVGTGYLNGTIVRPGEYFSFNDSIGDITAEAGYVEAPVVDGERIGKDVGGGICQVSTTVFRAAFLGGFPIGEWWPHLYRLPFYEYDGWTPGLDASILQSGPRSDWGDFTFKNSTNGYLLIEAWVQDQSDFVTIYGPDTGWTVNVTTRGRAARFSATTNRISRPSTRIFRQGPFNSPSSVRTASRFLTNGS